MKKSLPLVPGTRDIYKDKGSCLSSEGFSGYCGGFDARMLRSDSEWASMAVNGSIELVA